MKTIIKNKIAQFTKPIALRLNAKANKLSSLQKKTGVILFCFLCSIVSARIIIKTVFIKTPDIILIKHHFIPAHIGKSGFVQPDFYISPADFNRVELIKKYLDSLSVADKNKYAELIKLRPGLYDSITLFEKIYQSQSKK
jgi:hypothetical protein